MRPSEPEFIVIGKILASSGTKGKLKVEVLTDFHERFTPQAKVCISRQPMTIKSVAWHKGKVLIKLNSIDSIEPAQKLKGKFIEIDRSQLHPLPEGQYYYFQIIGLKVWTVEGELVGHVTEILPGKGNDSYVVRGSRGEVIIPAIEDIIKSIDLEKGRLVIEPISGLLS